MEKIKILFLTFVLSLSSICGTACWYDCDDDWDDCDDYYDNSDWYDIGWMFDDEDDDDEEDGYEDYDEDIDDDGDEYEDEEDIEEDDDEEDEGYEDYDEDIDDDGDEDDIINGPELDNVDVIGSYDENDTDDWEDDDYGWEDGEDDYNSDDIHTSITGNSNDEKGQKYKLQKTDKLSSERWRLNSLKGFKQGTVNTCVPAGMEFVAKLFNIDDVTESTVVLSLIQGMGFDALNGEFSSIEQLVDILINTANSNGLQAETTINIKESVDAGAVIMTTKSTESGNHDIIIVGYNDYGYIAYDTDKSAGYYVNIPESEVNGLYNISIKK